VGLVINEQGGAPFDNGNYGNVGFLEGKMVRPIMTIDDDEHDYDDNDDNEEDNQTGNVARTMLAHGTNPSSGIQDNGQLPTEGNEDHNVANGDAPLISVESLEVSDLNDSTASQPKVDTSCEGDAHDTVDDNDENPEDVLLHQAVCKALVNLKDKELPMATSIFYANHVLPSRPPDTSIELKRTSWKKFGPYLLEMQREELLVLSADKDKNPAGFIKSVNRQHLDLRGIKKEIMVDPNGTKSKLSIVTLYIIPNHFVDLMGLNIDDVKATNAKSEDRRGTGFLTQPEVRAMLDHYLTSNELLNRGTATLDAPLTAALFKKDPNPPTSISRKDLNDRWMSAMEDAYALVEMPGSKILKLKRGSPPKVLLEVEKRQNKKFITRVRGVEEYGIHAEDFCRDVAKRFACSGAVETDVGRRAALKKNQVELVFQGNLVEELRALLVGDDRLSTHGGVKGSDYCVPKQSIEVDLKKGVPVKKSR
jgi:translation initiation factor 2D